MFKRRNKRTYARTIAEGFYPRGGWKRAVSYVMYRLQRLPDPPDRIARGVAAGVFVSFTPFFGFHFFLAAVLGFVMRGNIVAALIATFFGNPFTFPIIATVSFELGTRMLDLPSDMKLPGIVAAFSNASLELWFNFKAMFTEDVPHWVSLSQFYGRVFKPYLVGGIVPGVFTALIAYVLSRPLIASYQKRRIKRLKKKYEKRMKAAAAKADAGSKQG